MQFYSSEETSDICTKCHKKKVERKEAIVELIHTEINYGQDLRILKEVRICRIFLRTRVRERSWIWLLCSEEDQVQ